jgi:hypothetical protein
MTEVDLIPSWRAWKSRPFKTLDSADCPITMGPEPRIRIFEMSVRLGIYRVFLNAIALANKDEMKLAKFSSGTGSV